jgi:hypothetical protein
VRGHSGDLARVVRLVAADRDEVSAPEASTSGTMYSSLRILLPPYAKPLETSSRFAQTWRAAEVLGQALQVLERARSEGERIAGETRRASCGSSGQRRSLSGMQYI